MKNLTITLKLTPLEIVTLQSLVLAKRADVPLTMSHLDPNGEAYKLRQSQLQTLDLLQMKLRNS